MGLFKDVRKPVIRQASRATSDVSTLRPRFVESRPPCSAACAAGTDVRGWVTIVAQAEALGRSADEALEAAWDVLAAVQPFAATLGRICPHPCEQACHRGRKDGAVGINRLERWIGDRALARGLRLPAAARSPRPGRVAIVGAGPAGLSCAYQLVRRGHRVEVFEAHDLPGGRLRDATRTGRLPAGVVDAEIARLVHLGVVLHLGAAANAALPGFDAVFLATGRASEPVTADQWGCTDRPRTFAGGDAVHRGLVPAAILSGRRAAEAIDAALSGTSLPTVSEAASLPLDRIKPEWYQDAARLAAASPGEEDDERAMVAESRRCFSCGLCMDCERCWMYCTNNCFEKLAKGGHYRLNVEPCNGCRKCADECPCGYIEMA